MSPFALPTLHLPYVLLTRYNINIPTHVQYNIQNIYKMLEAIKLNKYLLKGLEEKFKAYEGKITEASPGS